jgi:hypothetical protein
MTWGQIALSAVVAVAALGFVWSRRMADSRDREDDGDEWWW